LDLKNKVISENEFSEFIEPFVKKTFYTLANRVYNATWQDKQDGYQEAFIGVLKNLKSTSCPIINIYGLIYSIVRTDFLDWRRKIRRRKPVRVINEKFDAIDPSPSPMEGNISLSREYDVTLLLDIVNEELGGQERRALTLYVIEGMDISGISKSLGISKAAAGNLISRGRKKTQKIYKEKYVGRKTHY
jgi:RNA polymerase sigma factor (sigma-70 family)